jgi:hypothetical protein
MGVWKKWLERLSGVGFQDLSGKFIRANSEGFDGQGFWVISFKLFFANSPFECYH